MPGRVTKAAAASRTTAARKAASQVHAAELDVPDEGPASSLRQAICSIFGDSQKSTTGHRKCVISLRRLQEQCCYVPVSQNENESSQTSPGEEDFNREFIRCALRILLVRKSEPVGDRVVRFVGTYLQTASAKDNELVAAQENDVDDSSLVETCTSRLTTALLGTLIPLLTSKDKTVRFRATQIISHVVNSLDSLDDELFHTLRANLLKRIHDKEAPVRLQAVYGLGRLAADVDGEAEEEEDSDSERDTGSGVLVKLLNTLQHDPSSEVRRNLLLNLPLNKDVLPYLLERARDSDGATRRALYARLLPALGDFRHLSLTHREKLLRWGLRDRDDTVKSAAARLFRERWIEDCAALPVAHGGSGQEDEEGEDAAQSGREPQAAKPSLEALLELLERIDVVNSGAETGVAQIAMQEFWQGRPDYVSYLSFPPAYWNDLSPELAFVARTFNDYCRAPSTVQSLGSRAVDSMIEEKLPEVTQFGAILEREITLLIANVQSTVERDDAAAAADEDTAQREFVVEQLLHMALSFDYSDEVGRRKMFALMRETLALPELPEEVTRLVVDVLRRVCGEDVRGEREFCGVVLEAVAEVHDTIMSDVTDTVDTSVDESIDDSFHSANSRLTDKGRANGKAGSKQASIEDDPLAKQKEAERAVREIMVNMKCLHIAQCMLQNVAAELEDNVHLVTMLNNLIVPAVRSQEAPIRERGLVCLGLCCLLGKNLAQENLTLFLHCFNKGHPTLQVIALHVIGDVLVTHPSLLLATDTTLDTSDASSSKKDLKKQVTRAFSKAVKSSEAAVQATGVTALAKVMLSRLITDTDLLKQLVVAYFDPDTAGNAQLRQSLSYFLPVYCHCRGENAISMVSIACSAISKLSALRDAYQEDIGDAGDEDLDMVTLTTISNMIIDWTDPRKIVGFTDSSSSIDDGARNIHFLLAESILDRLVTTQLSKDEKKVLLSMLSKLHLPADSSNAQQLRSILDLIAEAVDTKVASDNVGKSALSKMQTQMTKLLQAVGRDNEEEAAESGQAQADDTMAPTDQEPTHGAVEEEDEDEDEDLAITQLRTELRESTIGVPDAEGTRMVLDDSDLL